MSEHFTGTYWFLEQYIYAKTVSLRDIRICYCIYNCPPPKIPTRPDLDGEVLFLVVPGRVVGRLRGERRDEGHLEGVGVGVQRVERLGVHGAHQGEDASVQLKIQQEGNGPIESAGNRAMNCYL